MDPSSETPKQSLSYMLVGQETPLLSGRKEDKPTPKVLKLSLRDEREVPYMLYEQYINDDKLCDLTIICGDKKSYRAHGCVMNKLPWFKSYFQRQSANQAAFSPVDLSNLPYEGLRIVTDYAYSGDLSVEAETVRSLMKVTHELRLDDLMKRTLVTLFKMTPNLRNVQFILSLCDEFHVEGHSSVEQLRQGFKALTAKFMDKEHMDKETLEKYIADETYSHISPARMATFLVDWTSHDQEQREQYFPGLFMKIKLQEIAHSALEKLSNHPLVKKYPEVAETVETLLRKQDKQELTETIIVTGSLTHSFALCNNYIRQQINVLAYIISSNKWIALTCLPDDIRQPSVVTDGQNGLCVVNLGECQNTYIALHRYSLREETWSEDSLNFPNDFYGKQVKQLVHIGEKIFVVVFGYLLNPGEYDPDPNTPLKAYVFEVQKIQNRPVEIRVVTKHTKVKIWKLETRLLLLLKNEEERVVYRFDANTRSMKMMKLDQKKIDRVFSGVPCTLGNTIRQYKFGSKAVKWYFKGGKLTSTASEKRVPRIPISSKLQGMAVIGYEGDIFIFGVRDQGLRRALQEDDQGKKKVSQEGCDREKEIARRECYRFDHPNWQWEPLADMPLALQQTVITGGRLPIRLPHCPSNCPHCLTPPSWCDAVLENEKPSSPAPVIEVMEDETWA